MREMELSWDARKAKYNLAKHKVSFEEASTVLYDENAIEFFDPEHAKREDRFLMVGVSYRLRVLVVCYSLHKKGSEVGIISARRATKKEQKAYTRGKP
ncbi:MAG: BrnT family toxin [Phycisphaerales bacterium]|nr:MAG: BrnT family toxin [Phycisphaerales bacterium]